MNNKNTSDFIAATMASVLDSTDHQELFSGQYKTAAAKCKDCQKAMDKCMCSMADDSDSDTNDLDMYDLEAGELEDPESYLEYDFPADDQEVEELSATAAFDVAIEGLLTASAALDAVDMNHSSELSLKLASLVVQAKKIKEEEKSVKSTKSTKSKKPAPAKKKLKSKDFKKMLEEDDDGKLTAANFKKMKAEAAYRRRLYSLADKNNLTPEEAKSVQTLIHQYRDDSDAHLKDLARIHSTIPLGIAAQRILDAREAAKPKTDSESTYGPQISVDREVAPFGQAFYADPTITEDIEGNQTMSFGPAQIAGSPYPPVSTNLQRLLGVKVDGKLGPETKNAIFKSKRDRGYPLSMSDKELEKKLSEPFDPYEDFK